MRPKYDERERRREYMYNRQVSIFSFVAVAMVACIILALLFSFHVFGLGSSPSSVAKPNYGVPVPCVPMLQSDGDANNQAATENGEQKNDTVNNKPKYLNNASIHVRVLNGTKFTGLARAVSQALQNRGFLVDTVGNYTSQKQARTVIYFGKNTIAEAYTLGSNFTDAILQLDNREDKLIDVIIGATFNDLKNIREAPAAGTYITNIAGCKDIASLKRIPQALQHDPVQ